MNKIFQTTLLIFICSTVALSQQYFGKKIKPKAKSITVTELKEQIASSKELSTRVSGTISGVCKMKGCWLTLQNGNETPIRVTFKDYGFFVPKDSMGKKVLLQGIAYKTETTVAELKHYAHDAGKTEEEIAKITQPLVELTFEADGVVIYE
jgi:hypothetical protein